MGNSFSERQDSEKAIPSTSPTAFEQVAQQAGNRKDTSVIVQLLLFVQESNRWWLLPVLLALLAVGIITVLGSTAAAPFIYALF